MAALPGARGHPRGALGRGAGCWWPAPRSPRSATWPSGRSAASSPCSPAWSRPASARACQHPLSSSLVSRAYETGPRRMALGTYNFSGDLGKVAVPAAVALALPWLGWRGAVSVYAIVGLAAAAVLLALLGAPGRGGAGPAPARPARRAGRSGGWGIRDPRALHARCRRSTSSTTPRAPASSPSCPSCSSPRARRCRRWASRSCWSSSAARPASSPAARWPSGSA